MDSEAELPAAEGETEKKERKSALRKPAAKTKEVDDYCNPCWHKSARAWTVKYRKSGKQALSVS